MTYERMKHWKPGDFKRACGVHPQTFETLLQVLRDHGQKKVNPNNPLVRTVLTTMVESADYFFFPFESGKDGSVSKVEMAMFTPPVQRHNG